MTIWAALGLSYGLSFACGVFVHADGPEPGFWWEWFVFGSLFFGVCLIAGWIA